MLQRLFKWLWMFNKRLYKKISFVMILVLILACVFIFSLAAKEESGFLNIVLVRNDKSDVIASQIVQELTSEKSLVLFKEVDKASEAIDMVKTGKADSAWIFTESIEQKVDDYVHAPDEKVQIVQVVEREQNVLLRLSREKITSKLYKYAAKAGYVFYARDKLPMLDSFSDAQLKDYFDNISISEDLFVYGDSSATMENNMKDAAGEYLTAPLRGLLSVVMVLCGMAAVLYYMLDEQRKTFALIPYTKRIYVEFAGVLIAVLNVALVVMISVFATGMAVGFLREFLSMLLFSLCSAAFCLLLSQIFGNIRLFGSVMPVFIIMMIGVCPVFFTLKGVTLLSHLFPPTYYIKSIYNSYYLLYMVAYAVVCLGLSYLFNRMKKCK